MSIEKYVFVLSPERKLQGIALKSGRYTGVIYEYDKVTFGEPEEETQDKKAILGFQFNVLDPYGFKKEDFEGQDFGVVIGDILVDIIDKYGTGEQFESDD